jgi:hypothetical protein
LVLEPVVFAVMIIGTEDAPLRFGSTLAVMSEVQPLVLIVVAIRFAKSQGRSPGW